MRGKLQLPEGLWAHQVRALETVHEYLDSDSRGDTSALLTMPTGTGKTGVIAASVTFIPSLQGHRLVLTPWDALVRQLITDIDRRFWERLSLQRPHGLPPVERLPSSSLIDEVAQLKEPRVYVATIAAIFVLARKCRDEDRDIAELFSGFGLAIVDEGHYEPAHDWSIAIRSLRLPTVLLTATPYRNDEKFFVIGDDWRYRFPHHEAVEERFLREPQFETFDSDSQEDFARQLVRAIDERFTESDRPRVIVRCQDASGISRTVRTLEGLGRSAIGVHHTFPAGDGPLRRQVPPIDSVDAQFWVHQNKLIEGIDDPRFKVVAFYDSLRNDRAIVQQIGRVLRNPNRDEQDMTARVLGRGDRDLARTWEAYLRFDRQEEAHAVATLPALVERVLASQPDAFYYDGGYRIRIDLTDEDAWREFAFPMRTRVFRASSESGPDLAGIAAEIIDEWREIDRTVFDPQEPDATTIVIPYVAVENSPFLRTGTFIEPQFGYTLVRLRDDLLFLYDTQGRTPKVVLLNFKPLKPTELVGLFPAGVSNLTSVALLNTDIGRQAARSRQLRAVAIDDLAPDLADYGFVCTIAEGYTEIADNRFRRYLGLSRARISDYRRTERDFAEYSDWLDEVDKALKTVTTPVPTFSRYAAYSPIPENPAPAHVLLDIDPTDFEQQRGAEHVPLDLEETAYDVTNGEFSVVANGQTHQATLSWNAGLERYDLMSHTLRAEGFVERDGEHRELLAYVNQEQALRIVPTDRTETYSHGHFFKPIRPDRRIGGFQLLDVMVGINALANTSSEKGRATVDDDWSPESLFGLISALAPASPRVPPAQMAQLLPMPDLLICTDMGTEVADFMATQPGRVVFIHAKASSTPKRRSASALHDVASQAIKNLPYLQPLSDAEPPDKRWTSRWKARGVEGSARRQRVGSYTSSPEMWKHIRAVIANPQAEREVWLVLGQSLSIEALKAEAAKVKPAAEALQIFSLLQTTWGAISQLGGRLRIFCSP
jgi:superfamily II DNA or RNA helicase